MHAEAEGPPLDRVAPPGPAPFRFSPFAFWLPPVLITAIAIAWLAVMLEDTFRPYLLFPLLVGVCVGLVAAWLLGICQMGHRPTAIAGTVLAALVAGGGMHHFSYLKLDRARQREVDAAAELRRAFPDLPADRLPAEPANLLEFLRDQARGGRPLFGAVVARGTWAWLSWGLDALVMAAGAVYVVWVASRVPFCDRCHTWYRVTRAAPLGAEAVAQLAAQTGIDLPGPVARGGFRLRTCHAGCGATRLELSWEAQTADGERPGRATTWLDAEGRRRAVALVDRFSHGGDAGDGGA